MPSFTVQLLVQEMQGRRIILCPYAVWMMRVFSRVMRLRHLPAFPESRKRIFAGIKETAPPACIRLQTIGALGCWCSSRANTVGVRNWSAGHYLSRSWPLTRPGRKSWQTAHAVFHRDSRHRSFGTPRFPAGKLGKWHSLTEIRFPAGTWFKLRSRLASLMIYMVQTLAWILQIKTHVCLPTLLVFRAMRVSWFMQ